MTPVGEAHPLGHLHRPGQAVASGLGRGGQPGLGLEGLVQLIQALIDQPPQLQIHPVGAGDGVHGLFGVVGQGKGPGLDGLHRPGGGGRRGRVLLRGGGAAGQEQRSRHGQGR